MNRNTESHFATLPKADIKRSMFDRSSGHKTTFNAGELVPIYLDEVLPGDTFKMKTSCVIRMTTPVHPVMDNAIADIYYFYVPCRLLWQHWKEFMGENTGSPWYPNYNYSIPQTTAPSGGWLKGNIADHFGVPTKIANLSVNSLPFRAYAMIWNEWFRDQNTQAPNVISLTDGTTAGASSGYTIINCEKGGGCAPVNKLHDRMTSCLPAPQKGPSVLLPLGDKAVVKSNSTAQTSSTVENLYWYDTTGQLITGDTALGIAGVSNTYYGGTGPNYVGSAKVSLYADLSNATAATINQLRQAFQIQRLYERDARGGTRYREIIKSHFGVVSPDGRQQVPEYLGGKRVPITINQVVQTSETGSTSPQGNTAAFSLTADIDDSFTKSFTEHGYIIGLCCVRTIHTYQYGLNKLWSRKNRFDFYFPALANISEQAVLNKEIYAQGTTADDGVFGYQEPWSEYRYKENIITGALRSNYTTSLDVWHYADKFTGLPVLNDAFMRETKDNIDRTLTVKSNVEDQFIADFYFKCECARPMPVYSVPGLIDHN